MVLAHGPRHSTKQKPTGPGGGLSTHHVQKHRLGQCWAHVWKRHLSQIPHCPPERRGTHSNSAWPWRTCLSTCRATWSQDCVPMHRPQTFVPSSSKIRRKKQQKRWDRLKKRHISLLHKSLATITNIDEVRDAWQGIEVATGNTTGATELSTLRATWGANTRDICTIGKKNVSLAQALGTITTVVLCVARGGCTAAIEGRKGNCYCDTREDNNGQHCKRCWSAATRMWGWHRCKDLRDEISPLPNVQAGAHRICIHVGC